jgi:putative component of membrane protein insertase Oxa1/YidC/SpoIIIJ protein YidD
MKKQLLIFCLFPFLVCTSKYSAVGSINVYQKYISPNKGWKCAYGIAHPNEISCSEFGKVAIENHGIIDGLEQLKGRFKECERAYLALGSQANTATAGCCGPISKTPLLIDGSKSEATLTFAYEYGAFEFKHDVHWSAAQLEANQRCKAWGFSNANFFKTGVSTCLAPPSCNFYRMTFKCQCEN